MSALVNSRHNVEAYHGLCSRIHRTRLALSIVAMFSLLSTTMLFHQNSYSTSSSVEIDARSPDSNSLFSPAGDKVHTPGSLGQYINQEGRNVFTEILFTRWRGPALYNSLAKQRITLKNLTYEKVGITQDSSRLTALQLSLNRVDEIDYAREFPTILKRFDLLIMSGADSEVEWRKSATWATGTICSCFIEMEIVQEVFTINDKINIVEGMHASRTKNCFRFLVLGASDIRLSSPEISKFVQEIQESGYFDRIYYEAMDINLEGVDPMPIGLNDFYVFSIPPRSVESAILRADLRTKKGLLTAWGAFWPHLDEQLPWRRSLIEWVNSTPWVTRTKIAPYDWYKILATYRFMACPDGNGVVSPKWTEALLVQTIPITPPLPYYKRLKALGYPFVIVNDWSEITKEKLDQWWVELSPRLEKASWMHTNECWWELLKSSEKPELRMESALRSCVP